MKSAPLLKQRRTEIQKMSDAPRVREFNSDGHASVESKASLIDVIIHFYKTAVNGLHRFIFIRKGNTLAPLFEYPLVRGIRFERL